MWERVGTKSFTGFLILLLTFALVCAFNIQLVRSDFAAESEGTVVRVIPEVVELGPENVIGETFDIAVAIENHEHLVGLDIQFQYNTTYLDYVSHVMTMPIEDFPDPIPPSPYAGIIHSPPLLLQNSIDPTAGEYWVAFATLGGPPFNGSGTVFVMTFEVVNQPAAGEEDAVIGLSITFASCDMHACLFPFHLGRGRTRSPNTR